MESVSRGAALDGLSSKTSLAVRDVLSVETPRDTKYTVVEIGNKHIEVMVRPINEVRIVDQAEPSHRYTYGHYRLWI